MRVSLPWQNFTRLQWAAHIVAWLPLIHFAFDWFTRSSPLLNINPFQETTLRTGWWALTFFVLSLACTPLHFLTRFTPILKFRRPWGLYGFMYASIHFLLFLIGYGLVEFSIDLQVLWQEMFNKQYAFAGIIAFTLLLPLAITSTKGWQKRLGKDWKMLHKLVYVAIPVAILHFVWQVKADYREPLAFGLIVSGLLILRWSKVKQWINDLRSRWRANR